MNNQLTQTIRRYMIARLNDGFNIDDFEISQPCKSLILNWFNRSLIYKNENNQFIKALELLSQFYSQYSDLDLYPRELREEIIKNLAEKYCLTANQIIKLYIEHSTLGNPGTKLIAFEGIDGSGKTVQINLLKSEIEKLGYSVIIKSFPAYDDFFGKEIGCFLSGKEETNAGNIDPKSMSLWYALDRWNEFQKFDYKKYDFVLLNRFTLSNAVYQGVRCKEKEKYEMIQWVYQLEHEYLGLPIPDLYLLLDINPIFASVNVQKKGNRSYVGSNMDVYEKSENLILQARKQYLEMTKSIPNVAIVNCINDDDNTMISPEEIFNKVLKVLQSWTMLNITL